jgi:phosphoglycolate phosphatase-like HAD superfamily hydrolase
MTAIAASELHNNKGNKEGKDMKLAELKIELSEHGIDLSRSWMIGDKAVDVACGRGAGCRTMLVRTGYGAAIGETGADFVVDDVVAASDLILAVR